MGRERQGRKKKKTKKGGIYSRQQGLKRFQSCSKHHFLWKIVSVKDFIWKAGVFAVVDSGVQHWVAGGLGKNCLGLKVGMSVRSIKYIMSKPFMFFIGNERTGMDVP